MNADWRRILPGRHAAGLSFFFACLLVCADDMRFDFTG
jgi:hypothetical protein